MKEIGLAGFTDYAATHQFLRGSWRATIRSFLVEARDAADGHKKWTASVEGLNAALVEHIDRRLPKALTFGAGGEDVTNSL